MLLPPPAAVGSAAGTGSFADADSFAGAAGRWIDGVTVVDLAASVPAPADAASLTFPG
jgi:hypothetical protein